MRVLFLEGYHGGSHRAFAEGWRERSRHDIEILSLPARKWKWRMQTGAWVFAQEIENRFNKGAPNPDVIVASDMIDLAQFAGLTRSTLAGVPLVLYFHENQYSYPPQVEGRSDFAWGVINSASALVADRVLFNSEFHLRDFFKAWRKGNRKMPDRQIEAARIDVIEAASKVVPVGVDFEKFDRVRPEKPSVNQPPLIVWNHRWEHDKNPEDFFEALGVVKNRGLDFRLAVCGENFDQRPEIFEVARERFADRIEVFGFLESPEDYARLLWNSDIVVSTAVQEFLGLSVLEAMWCGCYPLLPRRLSYPELLPDALHKKHLYDSTENLAWRLSTILRQPEEILPFPERQAFLEPYAWPCIARRLDAIMDETRSGV
ncbi:MAG: tRNA-queuosine alpha-mannosyltransferase domain-containing protein [Candidatus Sumerlaeota bacterium]